MALFKIHKGSANSLGKTGNITQYAQEGYAYFTPEDGKFYIDITGDGTTPAQLGINRLPLNAYKADRDGNGNVITSTYATKTELSNKANSSHSHSASDITSGTLNAARIPNISIDKLVAGTTNTTIPSSLLPSYVDDVLEYTAKSSFPSTGETGKIYVDKTTNLTYRWSGSAYVEISPSLALGTTSSTAYRGDYGNAAYTHAVTNKGIAKSSGLYKITTNSEGHVTAATAVTKADITALGIPGTAISVKLNGTTTTSANFYAPLSAGTSGYVLKSNGSGAPTWLNPSSLSVGSATKATQDGNGNVISSTYLPLAGGKLTGPVISQGNTVQVNHGTEGFVKLVRIVTDGGYQDQPIEITVTHRDTICTEKIYIKLAYVSDGVQQIGCLYKTGNSIDYYAVQADNTTFDIYAYKATWNIFSVISVVSGTQSLNSTIITYPNEYVNALPSGYTTASIFVEGDYLPLTGGTLTGQLNTCSVMAGSSSSTNIYTLNVSRLGSDNTTIGRFRMYVNAAASGGILDFLSNGTSVNSLSIKANGESVFSGQLASGNFAVRSNSYPSIYLTNSAGTQAHLQIYANASSSSVAAGVVFRVWSSASTYSDAVSIANTGKLYGAVWNDYAEYRGQIENIKPGYIAYCDDDGKLKLTTERLQKFEGVVSDTYGFAIGKNERNKTPIAVSGRALVYCDPEDHFHSGDCVCAGPNGLAYRMTREEIIQFPDRIVGIVSEIPTYETWGETPVEVNGRIWVKVR